MRTRNGFCLIIGYLYIICSGIGVILSTCIMGHVEFINYFIKNLNLIQPMPLINNFMKNDNSLEQSANTVRAIILLVLITFILMTIISAYFVSGIIARRHTYMLPWLLLAFILIVANVVIACFCSSLMVISMLLIGVAIQCLIFYTTLGLYIDIRRENKVEKLMISKCNKT